MGYSDDGAPLFATPLAPRMSPFMMATYSLKLILPAGGAARGVVFKSGGGEEW